MLLILKSIRSKIFIIILFFFSVTSNVQAQLNQIVKSDIDKGSTIVAPYFKNRIDDSVRLVGLGQIQPILNESFRLNSAISSYLIKKKGFNTIVISFPDWELRHFNKYLMDETRVFSENEFNSLFKKTFRTSTGFLTEDFKVFLLWLKKHNQSLKNNKVSINGSEFVIESMSRFYEMNNYFIETYVRPYNVSVADSIKTEWKSAGNSNSLSSDSLVLKKMFWWKDFIVSKNLMSEELVNQMLLDIGDRQTAYDWARIRQSSHLTDAQAAALSYQIRIANEVKTIENLMKVQSNKLIYSFTNASLINAEIEAYSTYLKSSEPTLVLPNSGVVFKERYKDKYFIVVSTFADSAAVLGYKNHQPYQPIVVAGDDYTKTMLSKKEVYFFPDDEAALSKLVVPIINSGFFKEDVSLRVKYTKGTPFDMAFIFRNLMLSKFITEEVKKN